MYRLLSWQCPSKVMNCGVAPRLIDSFSSGIAFFHESGRLQALLSCHERFRSLPDGTDKIFKLEAEIVLFWGVSNDTDRKDLFVAQSQLGKM